MRAVVLFACGCNSILGLHDDVVRRPADDAQQFDAPIDAPFACPPIGTAPTFDPNLHALPLAGCYAYSVDRAKTLAITNCLKSTAYYVWEGAVDGPVMGAKTGDDPSTYSYFLAHLSADGDQLVRARVSMTQVFTIELQHRDAPLMWSVSDTLPYSLANLNAASVPQPSTISAGPQRRVIVIDQQLGGPPIMLHEFASSGGAWTEIDSYPVATIHSRMDGPALSADGLRMVFQGTDGIRYTDRASLSARFGASQLLAGTPSNAGTSSPFLDDGCGKLYFSGLNTVFYMERTGP